MHAFHTAQPMRFESCTVHNVHMADCAVCNMYLHTVHRALVQGTKCSAMCTAHCTHCAQCKLHSMHSVLYTLDCGSLETLSNQCGCHQMWVRCSHTSLWAFKHTHRQIQVNFHDLEMNIISRCKCRQGHLFPSPHTRSIKL